MKQPLRRGGIWTAAGSGGGYARNPRPAIVIRGDDFDSPESVTMIPLTTTAVDSPTRILIPAGQASGIGHDSYAMVDKIHTYKQATVRDYCGHLTSEQLAQVEQAMLLYLGVVR